MSSDAPLITGTDFICVPTRDYDAAAEFYGEVLGLRFVEALGRHAGGRVRDRQPDDRA